MQNRDVRIEPEPFCVNEMEGNGIDVRLGEKEDRLESFSSAENGLRVHMMGYSASWVDEPRDESNCASQQGQDRW